MKVLQPAAQGSKQHTWVRANSTKICIYVHALTKKYIHTQIYPYEHAFFRFRYAHEYKMLKATKQWDQFMSYPFFHLSDFVVIEVRKLCKDLPNSHQSHVWAQALVSFHFDKTQHRLRCPGIKLHLVLLRDEAHLVSEQLDPCITTVGGDKLINCERKKTIYIYRATYIFQKWNCKIYVRVESTHLYLQTIYLCLRPSHWRDIGGLNLWVHVFTGNIIPSLYNDIIIDRLSKTYQENNPESPNVFV